MNGPHQGWWKPDFAGVIAILAVCALLFWVTFGFEKVPPSLAGGMSPEVFPRILIGLIAAMTLAYGAQAALASAAELERLPPVVYATFGLMVVFMAATWLIGMLPAMTLLIVALGWLWGARDLKRLLPTAVITTVAIWAIFVKALGIQLPWGRLGRLIWT